MNNLKYYLGLKQLTLEPELGTLDQNRTTKKIKTG